MTPPLPVPVPLDPPPGDPHSLADLVSRLDGAGALLGELGAHLPAAGAVAPSWTGRDAAAADAQLQRAGTLARESADAVLRASARVALHRELVVDARRRLAGLQRAQEDDFAAAARRTVAAPDPGDAASAASSALAELATAEAARRRTAAAIRDQVADDAAATGAVLAACSAVVGGSGGVGDPGRVTRYLEDVLPGWHAHALGQRGLALAAALRDGRDAFDREEVARELLPWAGNAAVAAAVLTELGAEGLRDLLRLLGDGSLSSGSALARAVAAVLGAPVLPSSADEVAQLVHGQQVGTDARGLDGDLVALGMGVVLAAGRGDRRAGPPPDTVREWGRQIVARERALGSERIVDRVRLQAAYVQPGDPLGEVVARLSAVDDPAPAVAFLRAEPTWAHLLQRPWDDGGEAFAALVERLGDQPGGEGDVAVSSGLRALASGLGDDGDPAGWTVDPATATAISPALGEAVAAHAAVVVEPLAEVAAGGTDAADRTLLRGLGYLSSSPEAADAVGHGLRAAVGSGPGAVVVSAGYAAVREYGARLQHALDGFEAQQQAERRGDFTDAVIEIASATRVADGLAKALAVGAVAFDLDGTWDAEPYDARPVRLDEVAPAAGGDPRATAAYGCVSGLLGAPTAPESPLTDWWGLAADLLPGRDAGRVTDVVEVTTGLVIESVEAPPRPSG